MKSGSINEKHPKNDHLPVQSGRLAQRHQTTYHPQQCTQQHIMGAQCNRVVPLDLALTTSNDWAKASDRACNQLIVVSRGRPIRLDHPMGSGMTTCLCSWLQVLSLQLFFCSRVPESVIGTLSLSMKPLKSSVAVI